MYRDLKLANVSKKEDSLTKNIRDRLTYFHACQKSLKGPFIEKLTHS